MTGSSTSLPPEASGNTALRQLAVIAIGSVVLGLAVQLAILLATILGGNLRGAELFVNAMQGVTWSFLVCMGVGIGAAILRAKALLSGIIGMIVAPLAVAIAKAVQRLVANLLELAQQEAVLSLGSVSVLRAIQYGVLGYLLGTLAQRGDARVSRYLGAGAGVGLILGGAVVVLTWWLASSAGAPLAPPALVAAILNEMIFPIGCALLIFAGVSVGQAFRRIDLVLN